MDALAVLAAAVPANVRDVCATLTEAGHQAVTVGGCVRDVLIGRQPSDWDVASSAHPNEVVKLFRNTHATGLQHGTVTVVTGRGKDTHVEVTTFRGEGAYSDARRPDHVVFGVPLVEDLARRDLTVNAIAYDPAKKEIIDPFGGRDDLEKRLLRAVGTAVDRFTEDGLRVMRAVRFAAQLEFELDPDTEAGIAPALPSLEKVSRERVCDELRKMLATTTPSRGLSIAQRTGILRSVLPELDAWLKRGRKGAGVEGAGVEGAGVEGAGVEGVESQDRVALWLGRIDRAVRPARIAALLVPLVRDDAPGRRLDRQAVKHVLTVLRALKFSNVEAELSAQVVGVAHASREPTWTAIEVRTLMAELDRDKRPHAIELWEAESPPNAQLVSEARRTLTEGHPLAVGDLAISGKDLMTACAMTPGPAIGRILTRLLDFVIAEPTRNTRDTLLAEAQRLELEIGR